MKNLMVVLLIIVSSNSYSQTNLFELSSNKKDYNGRPFYYTSLKPKLFFQHRGVPSPMLYDSIRALTEINDSVNADAYPWLSPDGLRMYFIRGAGGNNQLLFTDRPNTDSFFNTPSMVPLGISDPTSCWFSNDELNVYVCASNSLYFADRSTSSSAFNAPVTINLTNFPPHNFIAGASLNAAQNKLFLTLDTTINNSLIITEFSRTSSTSFAYVRTLIPPTGYIANVGQLSKDELTYYLGAKFNGGNSSLYQVTRTTLTDTFNLSTFQQIQGINDITGQNIQPSMSDDLNWVSFVRNDTNSWSHNDLYIAHKGIVSSVFDQETKPYYISLFPNPTSGRFTISLPMNNAEIIVMDFLGRQIIKKLATQKKTSIQLDNNGVYFVYVTTKHGTIIKRLIVNR